VKLYIYIYMNKKIIKFLILLIIILIIYNNQNNKLEKKRVKDELKELEYFANDSGLSAQLCCAAGTYGDKLSGCKLCPEGTTSIPYSYNSCSNLNLSSCKSCSNIHNECWVLNTSNKTCQPKSCSSGKTCVTKDNIKKGYKAGECYNII